MDAGRRSVILSAVLALGACTIRPLLKPTAGNDDVHGELVAIRLQGLEGRLGYLLRNALLDELNPESVAVDHRYVLVVRVRSRSSALGIQLDSTITRYNLLVSAFFRLLDRGDRNVLYDSTIRRVASYNASRLPFADLTAEQNAERRAANEVAVDIRTLLAVHFSRAAAAT